MDAPQPPRSSIRLAVGVAVVSAAVVAGSIGWAASRDFWVATPKHTARPVTVATVPAVAVKPRRADSFEPVDIAMWDQSRGLVAGHLGVCSADACKGMILRTEDGGRTWGTVYFGPRVWEVTTEGASMAWAVTDHNLLASDDEGGTWTVLNRIGHDLTFPTAEIGWGVSDDVQPVTDQPGQHLIRTENGGRRWKKIRGPCPRRAAAPTAVRFVDPLNGWVGCAGEPGAGSQMKAIYETLDGGGSWTRRAITGFNGGSLRPGTLPLGGYLAGMFFVASGHGWMWLQRDCVVATVDGGTTWSYTAADLCNGDIDSVFAGWFFDDNVGYVLHRELGVEQPLQLLLTNDGGATWSKVHAWRQNY